MAEEKPEKVAKGAGISRRSFLKGLTAAGAAVTVLTSIKPAKADSYGPNSADELSKEKLIWMQECMLKARYFDLTILDKMMAGDELVLERYPLLHSCVGEEAVATGVIPAMKPTDWCYPTHRCTIHNILRDMDMGKMFGCALYKATGYTKGRGNHFHISDRSKKVPNIEGLIGLGPIIAAGTAYGEVVKKSGNVVVKFSGDGDYNWPDTFCALNEAANFKLPIVFIIENNGYMMWVRTDETMAIRDVADRGKGFGIPGYVVDGMDPIAIYNVAKPAIDKARAGGGPSIIECKTYRYFDHMGARGYVPGKALGSWGLYYRSDNELRQWLVKDPIDNFERLLISRGILSDTDAKALRAKAKADVDKAWDWTVAQPNPIPESAMDDALVGRKTLPRQLANCPIY